VLEKFGGDIVGELLERLEAHARRVADY